jgi:hypothetical protein
MIGVTIGYGAWKEVAERAAARMEAMTDMECRVLPDEYVDDPARASWAKTRVMEAYPNEAFLIFDADVWCMKPWKPWKLLGRPTFVPEQLNTAIDTECQLYGLPKDRYVNGGLWIVNCDHEPLMKAVRSYYPEYGRWQEQTALNKALLELDQPPHYLPRAYNDIVRPNLDTDPVRLRARHSINLHFAGPKTPEWLMKKYEELT